MGVRHEGIDHKCGVLDARAPRTRDGAFKGLLRVSPVLGRPTAGTGEKVSRGRGRNPRGDSIQGKTKDLTRRTERARGFAAVTRMAHALEGQSVITRINVHTAWGTTRRISAQERANIKARTRKAEEKVRTKVRIEGLDTVCGNQRRARKVRSILREPPIRLVWGKSAL